MARTYVVTGSASGIGKASRELLQERGHRVIGVDLHDADVVVDLTTADGRAALVSEVSALSGGSIDAVLAVAGLAHPVPATVAVNYFGMVATLDGLRPLLAGSPAPRAAGVASMASLMPVDDELVALLGAGDEPGAMARAEVLAKDPATTGQLIYGSTKKAFCLWIRRNAATPDWAAAGIPLNAVCPGIIDTPMVADFVGDRGGARGRAADGADAAQRHRQARGRREAARVADERGEHPPLRTVRVHRRRQRRRHPRRLDLVSARA